MFMNKIDRLENRQTKLEKSLEEKKSVVAYKNSRLEAKITRLQELAFKNRLDLEKFEDNTKLRLDRNAELIRAEANYAKKLGEKYIK